MLANRSLHYVFDLWAAQWRRRRARGEVIIVRYCDDCIVGFQDKDDAEPFRSDLRERFHRFRLELHPEKTRRIACGRCARERRQRRGQGKPETFAFLGLPHRCGTTKRGKCAVRRSTIAKRLRKKLQEVKQTLRVRMHWPNREARGMAQEWCHRALPVLGSPSHHGPAMGMPGTPTPLLVSYHTTAQSAPSYDLATDVSTRHPVASRTPHYASVSRATPARHDPRQEPGAVVPHAGICAGGAG